MSGKQPTNAEILREQAHALERLIKEAQRIHAEMTGHLTKIHQPGGPSAPNKKR